MSALNGTLTLTHPVSGDTAQHIVGQRYLLADQWRWPPTVTRLIDAPAGVNTALTDSVPLLGLLVKPWAGLLPRGAHAIYLWIALCYVLQPTAGVFALRGVGVKGVLPALAVGIFTVCMPAFIFRFGHAALCGHFLVLSAIGVYFRMVARPNSLWWLAAAILMAGSLLVHPYFTAIVVGILAAAPLSFFGRGEGFRALITTLRVAAGVAVLGLLMADWGYLNTETAPGFGYYSLNLLSPLVPAGSSLISGFPMMDATGGQYEGYSYLGLGLITLTLAAMTQLWRAQVWQSLRGHIGLVVVAGGALLFAVSDRIYVGGHLLARLDIVPEGLRQFRASGRFVWVDLYLLVVCATCLLCRALSPTRAATVLLALAVLQFVDTRTLRGQVARQMVIPTAWSVDPDYYRPLLARHALVELSPEAACQPELVTNPTFMHLLLLASEQAVAINTIPVARTLGGGGCDTGRFSRPSLRPGELRLLMPGSSPNLVASVPELRPFCHHLPNGIIGCSKDASLADLPELEISGFVIGQRLSLADVHGVALRGIGWTEPASEGTWTVGGHATLFGTIDPAAGSLHLRMTAHGLARGREPQIVIVKANGEPIATWHVAQGADAVYQADVPSSAVADGQLMIDLTMTEPVRPNEVMGNGDARLLGFFLRDFSLDKT